MKPPLQALLLAEELVPSMIDGSKVQTVREGHRDYKPGKVVFACPGAEWSTIRHITKVIHTTVKECKTKDYKNEGWNTREDMLECLRHYYPEINMDSEITVIKFK